MSYKVNYQDSSVTNKGNIGGDVNTGGTYTQQSPSEKTSPPKNNTRIFSSFILPAIIIALGTIVAAFFTLLWK